MKYGNLNAGRLFSAMAQLESLETASKEVIFNLKNACVTAHA